MKFACPGCRRVLTADDEQQGAAVACRCGQRMRVPAVATAAPLPSSILTPIPPRPSVPPPPPPRTATAPRLSPRPALLLVGAAAGVLLLVVLSVGMWKGARAGIDSVVAPEVMSALDLYRAGPSMKGRKVRVKGHGALFIGEKKDGTGKVIFLCFRDGGTIIATGKTPEEQGGPVRGKDQASLRKDPYLLPTVTVEATVEEVDAQGIILLADGFRITQFAD